ncbi:hypothetical protein GCM10009535_15670 [Streptomyces thermocarboxydovorans]|uniref:Uncharacterized protein n=1 Tax=Streptomyces thermocarboxydovorans TaxID=59298 RepID=A0ABP3SI13_9ACTN
MPKTGAPGGQFTQEAVRTPGSGPCRAAESRAENGGEPGGERRRAAAENGGELRGERRRAAAENREERHRREAGDALGGVREVRLKAGQPARSVRAAALTGSRAGRW